MNTIRVGLGLLLGKLKYLHVKTVANKALKMAEKGVVKCQSARKIAKLETANSIFSKEIYNRQWNADTLTGYLNCGSNSPTRAFEDAMEQFSRMDKKSMDKLLLPYLADSSRTWAPGSDDHIREGILKLYGKRGTVRDIKYIQKYLNDRRYAGEAKSAINEILKTAEKYKDKVYVSAQQWIKAHGGSEVIASDMGLCQQFLRENREYFTRYVA